MASQVILNIILYCFLKTGYDDVNVDDVAEPTPNPTWETQEEAIRLGKGPSKAKSQNKANYIFTKTHLDLNKSIGIW